MKLPKKIIDANVILRFFLADDERQHARTLAFFEQLEFGRDEGLLTEIVFAEVVWVLHKVYKIPRSAIAEQMSKLIGFIGISTVHPKALFVESLHLYVSHPADIQDAFLAALAVSYHGEMITFDRSDFKKLGCDFAHP